MSRYELTAKSLAVPDSPIIRIGFFAGLAVSLLFVYFGTEFGFSVLAALIATGMAHNAYLLSRSERRRMVPGINRVAAQVSLWIAIGMWMQTAVLTLALHGVALDLMALSFVMIAIGLWFGWGDRLIFWILAILTGIVLLLCAWISYSQVAQQFIWQLIEQLSQGMWSWHRNVFAVFMLAIGSYAVSRYWRLATSEAEFNSDHRIHDILQAPTRALKESKNQTVRSISKKTETWATEDSALTRLQDILYGRVLLSRGGLLWTGLAATIVFASMVYSRGDDDAAGAFQFFGMLIIIMVPIAVFVTRVPGNFSRIWIMGTGQSRTTTAMQMLIISVKRSLPWFMIVTSALAIQSSTSLSNFAATLFTTLAVIGMSGVSFWLVAKWYHFWAKQSEVTILIMIVGSILFLFALAILAASQNSNVVFGIQSAARELLDRQGILPCLLISVIAVAGIWAVCLYDAAKGLGQASRLME